MSGPNGTAAPAAVGQTDTRADLAAAIADRDEAQAKLTAVTGAAQRGGALLEAADARLAEHGDLDARIADLQGERIATWAASGGNDPPPSLDYLPDDLRAARADRDRAADRARATRAASVSLDSERTKATSALAEAEGRVAAAATTVLLAEAEPLAAALAEAKALTWNLTDRLTALTMLWTGNPPQPVRPTPAMLDAINMERQPLAGNRRPEQAELASWIAYHKSLMADPAAAFELLPPPPLVGPTMGFTPTPIDTSPLSEEHRGMLRSGRRIPRALPPGTLFDDPPPASTEPEAA